MDRSFSTLSLKKILFVFGFVRNRRRTEKTPDFMPAGPPDRPETEKFFENFRKAACILPTAL